VGQKGQKKTGMAVYSALAPYHSLVLGARDQDGLAPGATVDGPGVVHAGVDRAIFALPDCIIPLQSGHRITAPPIPPYYWACWPAPVSVCARGSVSTRSLAYHRYWKLRVGRRQGFLSGQA